MVCHAHEQDDGVSGAFRAQEAEARAAALQSEGASLEAAVSQMQETLQSERAAAAAESTAARSQHDQSSSEAVAEAVRAAAAERTEAEGKLMSQLDDKARELQEALREIEDLQGQLLDVREQVQASAGVQDRNAELER